MWRRIFFPLFPLLVSVKAGYFTTNQVVVCPGPPPNPGSSPACQVDGRGIMCDQSCTIANIPDSCGALPFFSGLYGSVTCSSNTWNLQLCADSACGVCAPTITQQLGSECVYIPGVTLPPPLPSFSGFQMNVGCNQLTSLSFCLIGCAVISLLCCGCRLCCLYCCKEDKEDSFVVAHAAPLLPSINSPDVSKEELLMELAQAKKMQDRLSEQLISTQQNLLDVRDSMMKLQPSQHPTRYSKLGNNEE